MKKELSKLFTINIYDLAKAGIMTFLTTLGDLIYQALNMWLNDPSLHLDFHQMLRVAGISTAMYLVKQFFTGTKQPLPELQKEDSTKLKS